MAERYGYDVSRPARNGREAVQWTYFGYLAAIKEQNGAAMSIGRISTFLDIYLQRDIEEGTLTEEQAQELIDDLVIKFRIVRFLRTPAYNALFSGDPTWVTECIGGMGIDGRTLVTRTSFRMLNTLFNLGPAPEPNLTVLWSPRLPEGFKKFAAKCSIETSSIQYMNDDMMRPKFGDDAAIACCVSGMAVGKHMQFFGARVNLLKTLLYAINGGRDEVSGEADRPDACADHRRGARLRHRDEAFRADARLAGGNLRQRAEHHPLHARQVLLRVGADGVSRPRRAAYPGLRHRRPVAYGGQPVGDQVRQGQAGAGRDRAGRRLPGRGRLPRYGNNDERADDIASMLCTMMMTRIRNHETYRDAHHTQSVLTITANVVYGKETGNSPDGRRAGQPFAPGANPSNGADTHGALAAMMSVAKLPYDDCEDGISLTISVVPTSLDCIEGRSERAANGLDAYMSHNGFHANLNVLNRDTLREAMENPEKFPQLTIRVSGYAVNFVKLTKEQQQDVINRTFHGSM
jgi:formate C-acetyltransferase